MSWGIFKGGTCVAGGGRAVESGYMSLVLVWGEKDCRRFRQLSLAFTE